MKSPLRARRLCLRRQRKINKHTTAPAKVIKPTESPILNAVLCGTPIEETAEAVGEFEPEVIDIPDVGIIVMIVGCIVNVKMLGPEGEDEDEDEVFDAAEALSDVP